MKKYTLTLLCLTTIFTTTLFAQKKPIISRDLYRKAIALANDEEYNEAITYLTKIDPNDVLYFEAQKEISKCYYLVEKYEESNKTALALLDSSFKDKDRSGVYLQISNNYSEQKKYKEAIEYIDKGLQEYPNFQLLMYNKAVNFKLDKQIQQSIDQIQKTILFNPYYSRSHILLGQLAAEEGMLVQAILSYNTALFLAPEGKTTFKVLQTLNQLVSEKYESKESGVSFSKTGDDFSSIEEIIRSQVALNKKYKSESEFDFPVLRQNQALFSYLKNHENKGGFYETNYVPLYKHIYENGNFPIYSYLIIASSDKEDIQAKIKKNMKGIIDFYVKELKYYRTTITKKTDPSGGSDKYIFQEDGLIDRIGHVDNDDKSQGDWTYYYNNGNVSANGHFNDGNYSGKWEEYYSNGTPYYKYEYVNGKKNGEAYYYFENGNLRNKIEYKDDSLHGPYQKYTYFGSVREEGTYTNNKENGSFISYHQNGKKDIDATALNGKLNGTYTRYYADGSLHIKAEMKNGDFAGPFSMYYPDGTKKVEANYENGLLEGTYKKYNRKGICIEEGTFKKGNKVGTYKSYYSNGVLNDEDAYSGENGESGLFKIYDIDGKLYSEMAKNKKKILSLKYYDKSGNIIYESKVPNKEEIKIYNAMGILNSKGTTLNNYKDGTWTSYYPNGVVNSVIEYANTFKHGEEKYYHDNGKVSTVYTYKNDTIEGPYSRYASNGNVIKHGFYYNDEEYGTVKRYYNNGTLMEEFYKDEDSELQGLYKEYDHLGKLERTTRFVNDIPVSFISYDSSGRITYSYQNKKGVDSINYSYPNSLWREVSIRVNGIYDGMYKLYAGKTLNRAGLFIDGNKHGLWKWYNVLDSIDAESNYELGVENGTHKTYYLDGKLYTSYTVMDGEEEGVFKRYYYNGATYLETNYINGQANGIKTYYSVGGEKLLQLYLHNGNTYYAIRNKDGKALSDTVQLREGNVDILAKTISGKKGIEIHFKNGLLDSTYVVYGSDEKPMMQCTFKDDNINGTRTWYYTNGKVYIKEFFKDNDQYETTELYRENGVIRASVPYYSDAVYGDVKIYDATGKLVQTKTYYNDQLLQVK